MDEYAIIRKIAKVLREKIKAGFTYQSDPWGRKWKPLKPLTIRRKGHGTILIDTGALKRGIRARVEGERILIGIVGRAKKYGHFHLTGTRKMPARPWAPVGKLPPRWEGDVKELIRKYLGDFYKELKVEVKVELPF